MRDILLGLKNKPFIRNVIVLTSGTAAAQAIGIILSPVITRLFGPEAYGLMGTFSAMVTIIAPVAALTFPIAIVLPKNDTEAKGLIRLSMVITIVISIFAGLLLIFFHEQIVHIFNLDSIASFLFLLPFVIFSAGFLQIIEQWLIRTKQFHVSAKATFLQALLIHGGKVGVGLFYPVAWVLIIFTALAQGLKAVLLMFLSRKSGRNRILFTAKEKVSFKFLFKKYNDFPLFRAPEVFLNAISGSLPVLLLTSFFGPASAGFYSIGRTVLNLPSQIIGQSVGDVFYPRISEAAHNGENLTRLIKKATVSLGLVGIFPFGLIILFGPWLFAFVFGSEWYTAGEYARWIALWSFFGFMNRPSVRALPVLSAQAFHLMYTGFMLVTRVLVLAVGFFVFSSDIVAIALFGISGAILNIGLILITLKISRKFELSREKRVKHTT